MSRLGDIYLSGRIVGIGGLPIARTETEPLKLGFNRLRPAGMSVSQDFTKALYWNRLAAERGDADAQARLGGHYAAGLGCAPDLAEAHKWFLASAEQGCASGQFGLGVLHTGAVPDAADIVEAAAWFEKAVAQGNILAKLSLAVLLIEGQGLPADPVRAARLLTEAAEANLTEAMFRLGELYCRPGFVGRDLTLAETWLRRAGTRDHAAARSALIRLLAEDGASNRGEKHKARVG
jgi:TPR repeat protein